MSLLLAATSFDNQISLGNLVAAGAAVVLGLPSSYTAYHALKIARGKSALTKKAQEQEQLLAAVVKQLQPANGHTVADMTEYSTNLAEKHDKEMFLLRRNVWWLIRALGLHLDQAREARTLLGIPPEVPMPAPQSDDDLGPPNFTVKGKKI